MIGHVLKMLWQERRKYAGVLMEQMLIFVIRKDFHHIRKCLLQHRLELV